MLVLRDALNAYLYYIAFCYPLAPHFGPVRDPAPVSFGLSSSLTRWPSRAPVKRFSNLITQGRSFSSFDNLRRVHSSWVLSRPAGVYQHLPRINLGSASRHASINFGKNSAAFSVETERQENWRRTNLRIQDEKPIQCTVAAPLWEAEAPLPF